MIAFNFKTSVAIALICFVLGFCSSFLFIGGCHDDTPARQSVTAMKAIQKEFSAKEARYKERLIELEAKSSELRQELQTAKQRLSLIQAKTKRKETDIKKLIQPKGLPAKELLQKVNPSTVAMDTDLYPCDSLVLQVSEYMEDNAVKDSLYEVQAGIQDSIIAVKDSVIISQAALYGKLRESFDTTLATLQNLERENLSLRKKIKRQKFRSKLFTVGSAILSAAATNYLLQH